MHQLILKQRNMGKYVRGSCNKRWGLVTPLYTRREIEQRINYEINSKKIMVTLIITCARVSNIIFFFISNVLPDPNRPV